MNATSQQNTLSLDQIQHLEISREGRIMPRLRDLGHDLTLRGTLLSVLYPEVRVACVLVPTEPLGEFEETQVRATMAKFEFQGYRYKLVGGASSSAKKGLFYFVDERHHDLIAERFQHWPQAAISYFGILVSSCAQVLDLPQARVLVVPDHDLGTNDCGGWIRNSIATQLGLPPASFSQFRIAFGKKQGKGSVKVMGDDVADLLAADVILPESSLKPGLTKIDKIKKPGHLIDHGVRFCDRVVIGIREIARVLQFEPSYTVTQYAPPQSLIEEIVPETRNQIIDLNEAIANADYPKLLEFIGHKPGSRTSEVGTVEALLLVDKTGHIVKHPWVNKQLDTLLTRWTYKACTGGAYRLSGFALAHDGYLIARDGKVFHGSDWILGNQAICGLSAKRGLCVRHPVRMYDDLLPLEHISQDDLLLEVAARLEKQGCPDALSAAEQIAATQLRMDGTYVLHSETAKLNGGDFDFDLVAVLPDDRFPVWVRDRFARPRRVSKTKDKKRERHAWPNIVHVARKAIGNQVGSITDLITSCHAEGRPDLADELVPELQNALDSLKFDVQPNQEKIAAIRKQVTTAGWLYLKNLTRVSDLPKHVDAKDTDVIGRLYNLVRPEFDQLITAADNLDAFHWLIQGEQVTQKMQEECHVVHRAYGAVVAAVATRTAQLKVVLNKARQEFDDVRNEPKTSPLYKQRRFAKNQAQTAYRFNEERSEDEVNAVITFLKIWAQNKTRNRMAWAQALNAIVCKARPGVVFTDSNGSGESNERSYKPTGSLIFITFPQEVVSSLAQINGAKDVPLFERRLIEAFSRIDEHGRTFLVEAVKGGLKETFLFACRDGQISLDPAIPAPEKEDKDSKQAKPVSQPAQAEDDPEGLGHEIADNIVFQAEYGPELNANSEVPF